MQLRPSQDKFDIPAAMACATSPSRLLPGSTALEHPNLDDGDETQISAPSLLRYGRGAELAQQPKVAHTPNLRPRTTEDVHLGGSVRPYKNKECMSTYNWASDQTATTDVCPRYGADTIISTAFALSRKGTDSSRATSLCKDSYPNTPGATIDAINDFCNQERGILGPQDIIPAMSPLYQPEEASSLRITSEERFRPETKTEKFQSENFNLHEALVGLENSFEKKLKDSIEQKIQVEAALRRRIKNLEHKLNSRKDGHKTQRRFAVQSRRNQDGTEKCKAAINRLEREKKALEQNSRQLEKRNDILTELLGQSPTKPQNDPYYSFDGRGNRNVSPKRRSMMPAIPASPTRKPPVRPSSYHVPSSMPRPDPFIPLSSQISCEQYDSSEINERDDDGTCTRNMESGEPSHAAMWCKSSDSMASVRRFCPAYVSDDNRQMPVWQSQLLSSPSESSVELDRGRKIRRFISSSTQLKPLLLPRLNLNPDDQDEPSTPATSTSSNCDPDVDLTCQVDVLDKVQAGGFQAKEGQELPVSATEYSEVDSAIVIDQHPCDEAVNDQDCFALPLSHPGPLAAPKIQPGFHRSCNGSDIDYATLAQSQGTKELCTWHHQDAWFSHNWTDCANDVDSAHVCGSLAETAESYPLVLIMRWQIRPRNHQAYKTPDPARYGPGEMGWSNKSFAVAQRGLRCCSKLPPDPAVLGLQFEMAPSSLLLLHSNSRQFCLPFHVLGPWQFARSYGSESVFLCQQHLERLQWIVGNTFSTFDQALRIIFKMVALSFRNS